VISALLAGQLGWTNGAEVLTAVAPEDFAHAILRLHRDESLWTALRQRALAAVAKQFSVEAFRHSAASAIEASLRA
jgi:glycosyltransferase involved in cell wall biosynthesis